MAPPFLTALQPPSRPSPQANCRTDSSDLPLTQFLASRVCFNFQHLDLSFLPGCIEEVPHDPPQVCISSPASHTLGASSLDSVHHCLVV